MSRKFYDIWFSQEVGHVIVEASNKEEAKRLATVAPANFFQNVESYDIFITTTEKISKHEIDNMFPDSKVYIPKED